MAKKTQFRPVFLTSQREYITRLRVLHNDDRQERVAATIARRGANRISRPTAYPHDRPRSPLIVWDIAVGTSSL
jgi:hypothetical protein